MVKKESVLIFVLIAVFSFFVIDSVLAQAPGDVVGPILEGDAEKILNATQRLKEFQENLTEFTEEDKWEYLGRQWKELLLKNKYISAVDESFRKISFIFVFLFGEKYDLSLTLLFAILLWIAFFSAVGNIISSFSTLSKPVSWIVAFSSSVILAHLKFYDFISLILFKIIFFREGIWRWVSLVILLIAWFVVIIYIRKIIWYLGRMTKKTMEEKEKWDMQFKFKVMEKKLESVEKALGEVGGAFERA